VGWTRVPSFPPPPPSPRTNAERSSLLRRTGTPRLLRRPPLLPSGDPRPVLGGRLGGPFQFPHFSGAAAPRRRPRKRQRPMPGLVGRDARLGGAATRPVAVPIAPDFLVLGGPYGRPLTGTRPYAVYEESFSSLVCVRAHRWAWVDHGTSHRPLPLSLPHTSVLPPTSAGSRLQTEPPLPYNSRAARTGFCRCRTFPRNPAASFMPAAQNLSLSPPIGPNSSVNRVPYPCPSEVGALLMRARPKYL